MVRYQRLFESLTPYTGSLRCSHLYYMCPLTLPVPPAPPQAYDVLKTLGGLNNEELAAVFKEWNQVGR